MPIPGSPVTVAVTQRRSSRALANAARSRPSSACRPTSGASRSPSAACRGDGEHPRERPGRLERHRLADELEGARVEQHSLARSRQPGRARDRCARHTRLLRDDRLARRDADRDPCRLVQLDAGAHGAQRVVLAAGLGAEHRDQPFRAEALQHASVRPHGRVRGLEHACEHGPQRIRVLVLGHGGRQHGDDAPLADDLHRGAVGGRRRGSRPMSRSAAGCPARAACSSAEGSRPSSSRRSRARRRASSASACRPSRYSARPSCLESRSRSGCSATSASSCATSGACRPSSSSASIRSSSAVSRSASRRAASVSAHGSSATSASAGPRQSASASRSIAARAPGSCPADSLSSRSKRRASTASGSPRARTRAAASARARVRASCAAARPRSAASRQPRRRVLAPQLVDEAVGRHDLARPQQHRRQQHTLLPPRQRDRATLDPHLHRPEEEELHLGGCNTLYEARLDTDGACHVRCDPGGNG